MGGVKRAHESDVAANAEGVHPSRKRRLDYTEADAQLAKIYNDLADDVQAVRIKAAGEVIRNLSAKSDHQIERIEKAITRLIRGLCSGRKAARLGFSIALAEVLRLALELKDSSITLGKLTSKISELTAVQPHAGGQERRDYLLGRRFGYQAVLQSGAGSHKAVSSQEWQDFVAAVMTLMCEKQWLRRECGAMLYEYLVGAGKTLPVERLQVLVDALHANSLWKTPEGVAIWITLAKSPTKVKLPKGVWHHNEPLSANERTVLGKVVQEIPIDDEQQGGKAGSGSRQTAPSFAWTVILAELYGGQRSAKEFNQFWAQVVESGLFHSSSSSERKALGFQVLAMAISSAPSPLLRQLFTPNLTRCIINQRAGAQRYLFDAAKAALNSAIARSKQDPGSTHGLVQGLIEEGAPNFDQATKTKTIETLLGQANGEALLEIVTFVQQLMRKPSTKGEETQADAHRRMLADLLLSIVRAHKEPTDLFVRSDSKQKQTAPSAWLNMVLDTLIQFGYCEPAQVDEITPPLSDSSKSICRSRLSSCVAQLMNLPLGDAAAAVYGLLKTLRASKNSYFNSSASKETKALVKRTDKAIQDAQEKVAKTKNQSKAATAQAFALLFAMSVLQIYNEEPDAVPALEDLHACVGDWGKNSESASVLIELLLSFVSKQSALFRKLAEQVFAAFTGSLNADGLQSMLDILSQKESLSGQQELFAQGDEEQGAADEEGSDDGSAIDVEDMSDVEMADGEAIGMDGSEESGSDDDESEEDSDENDDEEGEEDEEELAAFDKKLAEALGSAGFDQDADEEDQDSDMDDEQMMAVEPALEKVFKEIKKKSGKKQENKDAKDNIINFKNRVLDLLNIYVKAQYANVLALDLLMPLAILIRTTTNKPTAEKAFSVLKTYFDACNKNKATPDLSDAEPALALLTSVHEEMTKDDSKLHASACSRASLFLAKVLVSLDPKHYSAVTSKYAELQEKWWLDPKSKVHGSVFTEWTSWSIATRKQA